MENIKFSNVSSTHELMVPRINHRMPQPYRAYTRPKQKPTLDYFSNVDDVVSQESPQNFKCIGEKTSIGLKQGKNKVNVEVYSSALNSSSV